MTELDVGSLGLLVTLTEVQSGKAFSASSNNLVQWLLSTLLHYEYPVHILDKCVHRFGCPISPFIYYVCLISGINQMVSHVLNLSHC